MDDYIHLSAMAPRANPVPDLAAPILVGQTMCGEKYYPGDSSVVPMREKDDVTCPTCLECMAHSGFA